MLRYLIVIFSLISTTVLAGGYDLSAMHNATALPTPDKLWHVASPPPPATENLLVVTIYPGSLKANIERIASDYGWPQLVWAVPYDYRWIGQTQIHATSLSGILDQLLDGYPLQAVFYRGNHILVINSRDLK